MMETSFLAYLAAHESAPDATRRLREYLVTITGNPIPRDKLTDLVVNTFHHRDFEQVKRWASAPKRESLLHLMHERFWARQDEVNVVADAHCSLAIALYECQLSGVEASIASIDLAAGAWELRHGNVVIATCAPICFERTDRDGALRVEKLIEGLHVYGDDARAAARLRSIPGLERFREGREGTRPEVVYRPPFGPPIIPSARSMAKLLRRVLADSLELAISKGEAQEALAAMFGFADWNTFAARDTGQSDPIFIRDDRPEFAMLKALPTTQDALWFLGKYNRSTGTQLDLHAYPSPSSFSVYGTVSPHGDPLETNVVSLWKPPVLEPEDGALALADAAVRQHREESHV